MESMRANISGKSLVLFFLPLSASIGCSETPWPHDDHFHQWQTSAHDARAKCKAQRGEFAFFSKGAYFSCQFNYKPTFNAHDTLCNNVRRLFETLGHHVKVIVLCKQPGCVFRNVFVGSLINGGLRKPVLLQKRTLSPLDMTGIPYRFKRSIKE